MDSAGYVALSRQVGLAREMQAVANNIANLATTGYRREGVIFAEHVQALEVEGGSVAMADAHARMTSTTQGVLTATGGTFDLAIEGDGFFVVETPAGERLTRAGAFGPNAAGEPVFVPPGAASVRVAGDGTLSVDGLAVTQIGRVTVEDPGQLAREGGVLFRADQPTQPAENGSIVQGYLEQANVSPVSEISRMIEVQRAYEAGQGLLEREDERIRQVLRTITGN